jgi:transposase
MTKKKPVQKNYTAEYRNNAVRLALEPGKTIPTVAAQLGVPVWKLRTWIKDSKEDLERSQDLQDLVRANNEIKRLKEEVEILKKAAAYFAKSLA